MKISKRKGIKKKGIWDGVHASKIPLSFRIKPIRFPFYTWCEMCFKVAYTASVVHSALPDTK